MPIKKLRKLTKKEEKEFQDLRKESGNK